MNIIILKWVLILQFYLACGCATGRDTDHIRNAAI